MHAFEHLLLLSKCQLLLLLGAGRGVCGVLRARRGERPSAIGFQHADAWRLLLRLLRLLVVVLEKMFLKHA